MRRRNIRCQCEWHICSLIPLLGIVSSRWLHVRPRTRHPKHQQFSGCSFLTVHGLVNFPEFPLPRQRHYTSETAHHRIRYSGAREGPTPTSKQAMMEHHAAPIGGSVSLARTLPSSSVSRTTLLLLAVAASLPMALAHDHGTDGIAEGETISKDPIDAILWIHIFLQMFAFGILFPVGMVLGVSPAKRRRNMDSH